MLLETNHLSGTSNVHEARSALGKRLRELRMSAGITGRQLAESLSWPASKVSKLENGRQTPANQDIRDWTRITGSESETDALLASLHTLGIQHADWQRQLRGGLRPHQHQLAEIDAKTNSFQVFEPATIPGLLQTAEYARARFAEGVLLFGTPNDIDYAVQTRMQRQELLYRRDKRFHFVLTEGALRYRRSSLEVQLAQLDRLMSLSALPNVKLGIIGFETQFIVGPWHAFWLRDHRRVTIETFSAELNLAQPQEVELYASIFEQMAAIASYGRTARAIITRVIDDLAADLPSEDGFELRDAGNDQ
jgi:transcriptional regulator with XRE-family HTH domain